mgnify:FL=1
MNDFLTIEQLMQKLENYPKDMLVLLDGYEGGLDAILDTASINVEFDSSKPWYYGPFEENVQSNKKAIKLISTRAKLWLKHSIS